MVKLANFTPGEAAKISGVSPALQRDWRRRGYLPKESGQAKFSAFDVAELMALNALAARSIGPQQAKMVSKDCASGILYGALTEWTDWDGFDRRKAWEGDFEAALSWEIDAHDFGLPAGQPVYPDWIEGYRARLLADRALRSVGRETGKHKAAFFWWADGSVGFYQTATSALETVDGDRLAGAMILIDNAALGRLFRERAGRPLAAVEDEDCGRTKLDVERYRVAKSAESANARAS